MFVLTHKAAIYDHVKQFYTVAEPYRPVVSNLPPFSAAIMPTKGMTLPLFTLLFFIDIVSEVVT